MFAKQNALEAVGCTVGYVGSSIRRRPTPSSKVVRTLGRHPQLSSSSWYRHVRETCDLWKPDILVASGIWISHRWRILSRIRGELGIPISFDMQGVLEELTEYNLALSSSVASKFLFQMSRKAEAGLLRHCADHVEVVSDNMEQYVRTTYPEYRGPITVVPCGIEKPMDDAAYDRNRRLWRSRLGLDPSRPAAVYSGSTGKWQRVAEVVEFARARPNMQVYLLLVGDTAAFSTGLPPNVRIASLSHHEAVEALCAFDFGFLLRRSDVTNFVAFPNKAAEYLNARLRVITDSRDIGCIRPEYSDAFISANLVDAWTPSRDRPPFELGSITWSQLAAPLLRRYLGVKSAMEPRARRVGGPFPWQWAAGSSVLSCVPLE